MSVLPEISYSNRKRKRKILIVTRVHNSIGGPITSVDKVIDFVKHVPEFCDVLLCIGVSDLEESDRYINVLRKECEQYGNNNSSSAVHILDVRPWGAFTHALNVAVGFAVRNSYDLILFMSIELQTTTKLVRKLETYFEGNRTETNNGKTADKNDSSSKDLISTNMTLVVGPSLPGHDFHFREHDYSFSREDKVNQNHVEHELSSRIDVSEVSSKYLSVSLPLRGRTCPWNTMAMWDVQKLGLTGFPLIGDGGFYNKCNEDEGSARKSSTDNNHRNSIANVATTEIDSLNQHHKSVNIDPSQNVIQKFDSVNATLSDNKVFIKGGVEEVSAVSLLQKIHPEYKAILIDATEGTDYIWNVDDFKSEDGKQNEGRKSWHESKMASKDERSHLQMQLMGIPLGQLYHIKKY